MSKKPWQATKTSRVIRIDAESFVTNRRPIEHFIGVLRDTIDADIYFWIDRKCVYDPIYVMTAGNVQWDGYLIENGWNYDTSPIFCISERALAIDAKHNPNVFVIKSN